MAQALAAEGVRVAVASRSNAKLGRAIESLPEDSVAFEADLSHPEGAEALMSRVNADFGPVDILVANAGGPPAGNYEQVGIADYRAALEQNLLAMLALCDGALGHMKEAGFGRVIAITSLWVKSPDLGLILSNTARTGLTAYLKTIATEVARFGITVNSLLPGLHRTDRLMSLGGDPEQMAKAVPAKALGDAESFGKVAAFLASTHAWYLTGQAILVDGGVVRSVF